MGSTKMLLGTPIFFFNHFQYLQRTPEWLFELALMNSYTLRFARDQFEEVSRRVELNFGTRYLTFHPSLKASAKSHQPIFSRSSFKRVSKLAAGFA